MILRRGLPDGTYVTITTRHANHSPNIYGKATVWRSERAYHNGDCRDAWSVTSFYLCEDAADLPAAVDKFYQTFLDQPEETQSPEPKGG